MKIELCKKESYKPDKPKTIYSTETVDMRAAAMLLTIKNKSKG